MHVRIVRDTGHVQKRHCSNTCHKNDYLSKRVLCMNFGKLLVKYEDFLQIGIFCGNEISPGITR